MLNPQTLSSRPLSLMVIGLLVLLLSGCGFHLKGMQKEGLQAQKIIYATYENVPAVFRQEFEQALIENHQQAIDSETADVKVVFLKGAWQRRSLTVTDTGIPAEYRLSFTLSYRFSENGVEKYRELVESRDFKSNNAQLLAVDSQQLLLKRQIQQRISRLIIRFLSQT